MIVLEKTVNLDRMLSIDVLSGTAFTNESGAHKFIITGVRNGEEQAFAGIVTARFIRADGQSFLLDDDLTGIEDGKAYVVLHQDCYNVSGRFQLAVFLTSGEEVTCIYSAAGRVQATDTGELVDTGSIVPNVEQLIEEIETVAATIPADYSTLTAGVVRHDIDQTLTSSQKARAQSNIGLAWADDGNGNLTFG